MKSVKRNTKAKPRKPAKRKAKAPKAVSKGLNAFDRVTGAIIGGASGTVRRVRKSVKALDRNLNRFGDEVEKLYDAQSKAGL